jgi:sterol desaturase/sphingolipid hydroxylase (fatty acid hydroxylase superfamily)
MKIDTTRKIPVPTTGRQHNSRVLYYISWISWPFLFASCCGIFAYGMMTDYPMLVFNLAYLYLIVALFFLERFMPHEKDWQPADGQLFADLAHTLSSKGTVQGILIFGGIIGLVDFIRERSENGIWPHEWPMAAQVILGVIAAEFGLYWAHRLGHEWPLIWRFHAIHHSVRRLWIINTGRFHCINSLISIILGLGILIALGAPMEIIKWLSAITAFIGMLTHCNVEMRFGWLSAVFNTPELHRWHHSKVLREGNKNYCENVMLWDWVFFSYFNENWRRPPKNIGITTYMPPKFSQQLLWPFMSKAQKARIEAEFEGL